MSEGQENNLYGYVPPAVAPVAEVAPAAPTVVEAAPVAAPDVASLINQLSPDQQVAIVQHAQANGLTGEALREFIETNINQQSVNAEASLLQGGYDAGVARAVAESVGVGGDTQATQQAAADYARMAAQAVANGQPLDQVRFNDPALTDAAKEAIYEQVAQQQGTTAEQVAQKAAEEAARDRAAIQGMLGALVGGAAVLGGAAAVAPLLSASAPAQREPNEYGIESDRLPVASASLASLGLLARPEVPDVRTAEQTRGQEGWSRA